MTNDTITARVNRYIPATPERVFDAWLTPDAVRAWMGAALASGGLPGEMRRVEIDARVGGKFTFSDMREQGEAVHWGSYLVIDRPLKLVFAWFTSAEDENENQSTVTITFEPQGAGCQVNLIHKMDARWNEYVEKVEDGWARMLKHIGARLSEPSTLPSTGRSGR